MLWSISTTSSKVVHGYQKQGSGYGYPRVRGWNALSGIVSTTLSAPVIIGARLRPVAPGLRTEQGSSSPMSSPRAPAAVNDCARLVLLLADSAFYRHAVVAAAHRAGAKVSITARMDPAVNALATIPDDA